VRDARRGQPRGELLGRPHRARAHQHRPALFDGVMAHAGHHGLPLQRRVAQAAALALTLALAAPASQAQAPAASAPAKAALTVSVVSPVSTNVPTVLPVNGNIAAWQEALIGSEVNGLRLAEVRVDVGDSVRRGQVLATFADDTARAELAQGQASLAEAEAALVEAAANAARARELQDSGAFSASQIQQYQTLEQTSRARVAAQRAALQTLQLRLSHAQVLAPDAGVISARSATVGAVVPAGQELFRLIRGGRLEWRAEVTGTELTKLAPGMRATLTTAGGEKVEGTVRAVAPSVDPATRNGIVYVDLPTHSAVRAGTFARGEFELGRGSALTLPQSAVVLRDGFAYVFLVSADNKVVQSKVDVGRRLGDRIEVIAGLPPTVRVVETGGGFLADGDTVRVVETAAAPVKSAQK